MQPWSRDLLGSLDEHVLESEALRGNPLGDPAERPIWVYLPPGCDQDPERRYPSIYLIQGYMGFLPMWWNRQAYRTAFPAAHDAGNCRVLLCRRRRNAGAPVQPAQWRDPAGRLATMARLGSGAHGAHVADALRSQN